jgi:sulfite reductase (NADPH) flavoprotein alpha-component
MLAEGRLQKLHEFVSTFSKEELVWINGYLSGLLQNKHGATQSTDNNAATTVKKITILYGTETGNAKKLGNNFAATAKKKGIAAKLLALDQYRLSDLAKEDYFFVIVSTHGEGEPPAAAEKFYQYIHSEKIILNNLKYGVLALGDTSYPLFCKTGEDIDAQLHLLGGKRIVDLQKCDVDFETPSTEWFEKIFTVLSNSSHQNTKTPVVLAKKPTVKKTYEGKIITHINLNDRNSSKETFHIEIATDEQPEYEPGDSAGIFPHNKKEVVDKLIELTGVDGNKKLSTAKLTGTIRELLAKKLNLCYLLRTTVQKYAAIASADIPDTRMDLLDLIRIYPLKTSEQFEEVVKILNPISPRLYTIASSPAAHSNEVHLTVAKNQFTVNGEQRFGVCSEYLGDLEEGTHLSFYIHKNRSFKLPAPDKDIVMIGPGTGIAPFRSFVAERDLTGATGRNWLFYGDRNFTSDFLYQTEWQQYAATGVLTKINLAWSRDGKEKNYVQHELKKEAQELIKWIDSGAFIYLCGSKEPMAVEVEKSIIDIISGQKNISVNEAQKFLSQLSEEGRYEKDVY